MKTFLLKSNIILLCIIIVLSSCASKTMIYSSPSAKVYMGGKLKGETPYEHKDRKITFMTQKFRLESEGYKPLNAKIRRSERVGKAAVYFGFMAILPFLWVGHYDPYHAYVLKPKDQSKKVEVDFIKYKEPSKFKTRIYNPVYIGKGEKSHFVYFNNQLSEYSKSFRLKGNSEVFQDKSVPSITAFDGYVKDGKKYILGVTQGNQLTAITINSFGKPAIVKLPTITNKYRLIAPDFKYGYTRSENGQFFVAYNESELTILDQNLTTQKEYKCRAQVLEAQITSKADVFSLEAEPDKIRLVKRGTNAASVTIDISKERDMNFFRLNVDEKLNKAFVSYLISAKAAKPKRELSKREKKRAYKRDDDFVAVGVFIAEHDLSTLKKLSSKMVLFDEKVVSQGQKRSGNGLKYIVNQGVKSTGENTYITLEEQWIVIVTSENGSKEVLHAEGIITINSAKENNPMIYIPKRGLSTYDYDRLSYNQIVKDNKIHYLFNDNIMVGTRPAVRQVVIDSDMKYLSQDVLDLYKIDKTLLYTNQSFPLPDGTRLIFHARKKKLGAGIIKF